MLSSLFSKRAVTALAGLCSRKPTYLPFSRFLTADTSNEAEASESAKEPEKPKRVSMMPPLNVRLEQDRMYKEVHDFKILVFG